MADGKDAGEGRIVEINISPDNERLPQPVEQVKAVAGRGLEGDRYYRDDGEPGAKPDEEITLIALRRSRHSNPSPGSR